MKFPLLLLAAFSALPVCAGDDFGIWSEANVQKDFSKKFSLHAGFEFRSMDKVTEASRYALSAGATYKPFSFLSIGAGYTYIRDHVDAESKIDYNADEDGELEFNGYNVDHAYGRNKHRASFDITGKVDAGRFTFSVRERFQYTHYQSATTTRERYRAPLPESMGPENWTGDLYPYGDYYFTEKRVGEDEKRAKDKYYLRSRFKVEYNIKHCPLTPYVSYEFTNNLEDKMDLKKTRLAVGTEWKITKQHRLDFAYLYEDGFDDDSDSNRHVLSIGYKFKF